MTLWLGAALILGLALTPAAMAGELTLKEQLGKELFFDEKLSTPEGMACATCHHPSAGFADPRDEYPVSQGVLPQFFGDRNSPTAAYAAFSPVFHWSPGSSGGGGGMGPGGGMGGGGMGPGGGTGGMMEPGWVGGQFWDGRAADLVEQAQGPFLNPLEMRNPNETVVVNKVRRSDYYADLYVPVYGPISLKDVDTAYENIADAIAAYESSTEVNPFTSKYDYFLKGEVQLTPMERMGMMVYNRADVGCATCHPLVMLGGGGGGMGPGGGGGMGPGGGGGGGMGPGGGGMPDALFTDFHYRNLGTPANPLNPFYSLPPAFNPLGDLYVDYGLGNTLRNMGLPEEEAYLEDGKFKTPTLRNVAVTPPYMHNGVFTTLMQVVHFYNRGTVLVGPSMDDEVYWPPEVDRNVDDAFVGGLDLTAQEGMALVAFLHTLTDGWEVTE
jgi:cytochrome c peroxidase